MLATAEPDHAATWLAALRSKRSTASAPASYNKTYVTMAGVIVVLLRLWISNLAILLAAPGPCLLASEISGRAAEVTVFPFSRVLLTGKPERLPGATGNSVR
ncbi:hypothetical protein ACIQUU_25670 [Streptomyces sp. NPDC101116]|uniref:hypothetical protein n=1 Tax=Streptomyces sp. NPDC101116 TaxID=3366107 RepID=UPI003815FA0B